MEINALESTSSPLCKRFLLFYTFVMFLNDFIFKYQITYEKATSTSVLFAAEKFKFYNEKFSASENTFKRSIRKCLNFAEIFLLNLKVQKNV